MPKAIAKSSLASLYTMDTLLSQLKGQGSPFPSPSPISNVEKLLDTIHLLSQATVLVAHQLQEQKSPVPAKPPQDARPLVRHPTSLPTPKPSPPPTGKKAPPPKPSPAPMLPWVLRHPEYYHLPPPNPTTTIRSSVATHSSVPTPKPITPTPHTKKDRKPKSKRTNPSTQPNPVPNPPTSPATPRPAPPDQRGPLAPPTPSPTSGSVQTDRGEPPNPLPTPTPSTPPSQPNADAATVAARLKAKRKAKVKAAIALAASSKPPTPTPIQPPPFHQDVDDPAPIAPSNDVINFPHTYEDCPRLPECPAHRLEFAVYQQSYADKVRGALLPPPFPQPYTGSGFELRAERDTAWWPVPPSTGSSPPGTPVDPEAPFSDDIPYL